MEKNIMLSAGTPDLSLSGEVNAALARLSSKAMAPLEWLGKYYSRVVGREVSKRQTLLLLATQAAFVLGVFGEGMPLVCRALSGAAFLGGLLKCKESLGAAPKAKKSPGGE